jgi:predicted ATP-dependent protease
MTAKLLSAADISLPSYDVGFRAGGGIFSLSSHARAREALEFGLGVTDPGFNIFVVGEDRSGRMTATLSYLERHLDGRPPPNDWIYINNFRRQHRPRALPLPAGVGRQFRDRMASLVKQLREALTASLGGEDYQDKIRKEKELLQGAVKVGIDALRVEAQQSGLDIVQTQQGHMVAALGPDGKPAAIEDFPGSDQERLREAGRAINAKLAQINRRAIREQASLGARLSEIGRQTADDAISVCMDDVQAEFAEYRGLARWLVEMRADVLDNLDLFLPTKPKDGAPNRLAPEHNYAVNLFVDHSDDKSSSLVLEANPTYENLFGRIEYHPAEGGLVTDFTMIRAGSVHRANGGMLVLRAEALARNPTSWDFLKGALRDGEIRIEEPHRAGSVPLAGAPRPKAIALDIKVVIVGAPRWYYTFFSVDPDFQTYFKVKADIDADMESTPANLACYAALIRTIAHDHRQVSCDDAAVQRLLGMAARWAEHREKLTARFEILEDVVTEAAEIVHEQGGDVVTEEIVIQASEHRRRRNARVEDRMQRSISEGTVMIDTSGEAVGQINALTVRDLGDHAFGGPSRVTARASVGRLGVINVERHVALGGPIQQKGVMVLQGYLAGCFAKRFPLSFNCSITFEQNYGGVEGDSASLAELVAILSDLSGAPLRQDIAITGSVNQRGESQAIGGAHHKIEGFFRSCVEGDGLTGNQGVVIPAANEKNLILRDEVAAAVAEGTFHIWSAANIDDAVALYTGLEAGQPDDNGGYSPNSVYGQVMARLAEYDAILFEREKRAAL